MLARTVILLLGLQTLVLAQGVPARVRPPEAVTCPRDDLTLYAGRVIALDRQREATSLTIATDWKTTERVTIKHAGGTDPAASFLMNGKPFPKDGWAALLADGKLRDGVRVNAWVCRDGRVTIDWQGVAPRIEVRPPESYFP